MLKQNLLNLSLAIVVATFACSCSESKTEKITEKTIMPTPPPPPSYPGGNEKLAEYLKTNIIYPENAKKNKVEGTVYIEININTDGSVREAAIAKSSGNSDLDREAIRVINEMPKWEPSIDNGKSICGQLVLPISFKLS